MEYGFPSWRKLKAHVELVREKLDAVVPPDALRRAATENVATDDPDLTKMFAAVDAGELQAVTDLLTRRPALASAQGPDGQTPLHMAAQYNDPRIAAVLVAYGADVNAKYGRSGHSKDSPGHGSDPYGGAGPRFIEARPTGPAKALGGPHDPVGSFGTTYEELRLCRVRHTLR